MTHSRHPEDDPGWSEYAADPSQWQIPANPTDNEAPQEWGAAERAVGPYGATEAPWTGYDERDPAGPRESTPYDETSQYTNNLAWRYQQNPYRRDPDHTGGSMLSLLGFGAVIGLGLLVLAVVLL